MADLTLVRRSPLTHLSGDLDAGSRADRVSLAELPYLGMVSLRVDAATPAGERCATVLGAPLPRTCGVVTGAGEVRALWLGPDEFLVVTTAEPTAMVDRLAAALGEEHGQVVDVSANRTTLVLSGPRAREVLEKGCPVDLHPRAISPGTAVATTLARVPVILWHTGPEEYRLMPRSSFAVYAARWLLDAMAEYVA